MHKPPRTQFHDLAASMPHIAPLPDHYRFICEVVPEVTGTVRETLHLIIR